MDSETRVALITGAGSGLGREMARTLARAGFTVAAIDRQENGLLTLEDELRGEGRALAWEIADVTNAPEMEEKVHLLESRLGPVDLLIANAGIGGDTPAIGLCAEEVANLVQVNLLGLVNTIAPVLQGMIERRRGHIVGISSLASLRGLPGMLGYCASKAGVNAFLDGLRLEVKPHSIAVTTICPGWMRTPMNADMKEPRPALMEVDIAVQYIMTAIRCRRNFLAFPWTLGWGLGALRWLRDWLSDWLVLRYLAQPKEQKHIDDVAKPEPEKNAPLLP
jgi:NAD(P)-dependent dehydrogenase (short-subunit alcohol dehydrogenase family)